VTQHLIVRREKDLYVYSWTTGVKPAWVPTPRTEQHVLAHALWLARNGREEEADRLLENFCSRNGK
jgi:hypothetical protein